MMSYKAFRKILDDKIIKNGRHVPEKDIYSRIIARLILCASWNRIYNITHSSPTAPLLPKVSFFDSKQNKDNS